MAATGKTPILLYGSTTPTNTPSAGNLTNSSDGCEIAINVADKNLFFKDATNTVNTVPIRRSSASSNGWLSSTDWNTFNNKQPAGTYVTSVTGTAPVVSSGGTTPAISMAAANGSTNGYLTSTDWTTFNSKVSSQWTTSGSNIYYTAGNVGVGTSTPGARLGVSGNQINYGTNPYIALSNVYNDTPSYVQYLTTDNALSVVCAGGANTGYIKFVTGNGNEHARIFASGGVSIGNTTDPGAGCLGINTNLYVGVSTNTIGEIVSIKSTGTWNTLLQIANGANGIAITNASGTASYGAYTFYNNGTTFSYCGSISVSGTTTTYATSSDYRLKNIDGPLADSGTFIDALKPCQGSWKSDGSKFVGFVAHELQEISPSSVVGTKDAVDENGKPLYQSVQSSSEEVIANMVAELQSLRQRVAILEGK